LSYLLFSFYYFCAQEAQVNAKLYAQNLSALTSRISASVDTNIHPLLTPAESVKNILILIITSDKGLCGAFNHNANKQVASWIRENNHHERIDLACCGKRGYMFFSKQNTIKHFYEDVTTNPQYANAKKIGDDLSNAFLNN